MSYFPKPSLNENDLAIIERGDTAAHSIEAGQYVSWKGRTGRAKAAILQGATLDDTLFDYDENGLLNASIVRYQYTKTTDNYAQFNLEYLWSKTISVFVISPTDVIAHPVNGDAGCRAMQLVQQSTTGANGYKFLKNTQITVVQTIKN